MRPRPSPTEDAPQDGIVREDEAKEELIRRVSVKVHGDGKRQGEAVRHVRFCIRSSSPSLRLQVKVSFFLFFSFTR